MRPVISSHDVQRLALTGDVPHTWSLYIDTAQAYGNEEEAGRAFHESGLARSDVFITTKFSGRDGLDIETSIQNSLKNVRTYSTTTSAPVIRCLIVECSQLGVSYVDLYLIHHPRLATPDIPTAWAKMEKLKSDGLAKCVSCLLPIVSSPPFFRRPPFRLNTLLMDVLSWAAGVSA